MYCIMYCIMYCVVIFMYEVISGILSTLYCYKYLHCTSPDQILSQLQLLHIHNVLIKYVVDFSCLFTFLLH